jgi:hypothetical protein
LREFAAGLRSELNDAIHVAMARAKY